MAHIHEIVDLARKAFHLGSCRVKNTAANTGQLVIFCSNSRLVQAVDIKIGTAVSLDDMSYNELTVILHSQILCRFKGSPARRGTINRN